MTSLASSSSGFAPTGRLHQACLRRRRREAPIIAEPSGRADVASCVLIGLGSIPSPRPRILEPLPQQAIGVPRPGNRPRGTAARVCPCLRVIRRDQSTERLCQTGPSIPFKRAMWRGRSGVAFSAHEALPSADNRTHRTSPTVNPSGLLSWENPAPKTI